MAINIYTPQEAAGKLEAMTAQEFHKTIVKSRIAATTEIEFPGIVLTDPEEWTFDDRKLLHDIRSSIMVQFRGMSAVAYKTIIEGLQRAWMIPRQTPYYKVTEPENKYALHRFFYEHLDPHLIRTIWPFEDETGIRDELIGLREEFLRGKMKGKGELELLEGRAEVWMVHNGDRRTSAKCPYTFSSTEISMASCRIKRESSAYQKAARQVTDLVKEYGEDDTEEQRIIRAFEDPRLLSDMFAARLLFRQPIDQEDSFARKVRDALLGSCHGLEVIDEESNYVTRRPFGRLQLKLRFNDFDQDGVDPRMELVIASIKSFIPSMHCGETAESIYSLRRLFGLKNKATGQVDAMPHALQEATNFFQGYTLKP
jgi:hypothetical protein